MVLFISSCGFRLASDIISFQPEGLLLVFLTYMASLNDEFLCCYLSGNALSCFHFCQIFFFHCFQDFLFLFEEFDYALSSYRIPSIYPSWCPLSFLHVQIDVFHQVQEIFSHYSYKQLFFYLPLPTPSETFITCIWYI